MEDFFVVPIVDIDPSWSLRGFRHEYYASEYCKKVLGIPSYHLAVANLCENSLEINLTDAEKSVEEEWYKRLRRISKYDHK